MKLVHWDPQLVSYPCYLWIHSCLWHITFIFNWYGIYKNYQNSQKLGTWTCTFQKNQFKLLISISRPVSQLKLQDSKNSSRSIEESDSLLPFLSYFFAVIAISIRFYHTHPNYHILYKSLLKVFNAGLSHPFLGMGPGPMELGKLTVLWLKLRNLTSSLCMRFPLLDWFQ